MGGFLVTLWTFQSFRDLVARAQKGGAFKVQPLGIEQIDGHRAQGFRLQIGAIEIKIWADPKTLLPIRVEETTGAAAGSEVRIVMSDFQVGVDTDESLFSVDLPAGYTVQETMQLDLSKKPVAYLVEALKWAAENNDGVFPATMRGDQGLDGIARRAGPALAEKVGNNSAEVMKSVKDVAMKLSGAFGFLFAIPPDAWHYAGKDVKLNAPNRPIFWYKLKTDAKCTVIYADLSIKEVPASEAPTMPGSEGSSSGAAH